MEFWHHKAVMNATGNNFLVILYNSVRLSQQMSRLPSSAYKYLSFFQTPGPTWAVALTRNWRCPEMSPSISSSSLTRLLKSKLGILAIFRATAPNSKWPKSGANRGIAYIGEYSADITWCKFYTKVTENKTFKRSHGANSPHLGTKFGI